MKVRKSQVAAHALMYILTAVLVVVILVYGYNAVVGFRNSAEQLRMVKFRNDVANAVKNIYFESGTVQIQEISVPAKFDEVCFLETQDLKNPPNYGTLSIDALMDDAITDFANHKSKQNIFLRDGTGIMKDTFHIEEKISVENDLICIRTQNGAIKIRLEGKGNHARISGP